MKKILITGNVPQAAMDILTEKYEIELAGTEKPAEKSEILDKISDADALLCILSDSIDSEIINKAGNLKIISNFGAGYNNIDISAAQKRGIMVTNTPLVSTQSTAELTIAIMLSAARRIVAGDAVMRNNSFEGWSPQYHLGYELYGKTLGIIGLGEIGKAVAKIACAFGMKVIYHKRSPLDKSAERFLNVRYVKFEDLIKTSDFISLHLSYSPALRHLIGERELAMMKPSAFLINAARGPLVSEEALVKALTTNLIKGAALDVFENEPKISQELASLKNVILTPHIGNATYEARNAMARVAAENIIEALEGQTPRYLVG